MIRFHEALAPETFVDADALRPHPQNYNNGDVDAIRESLRVNGCYRHVWASRSTGHIVGGHHLYEALLAEGEPRIPVLWLDLDYQGELRILGADNWVAARAWRDPSLEIALLRQIQDTDLGLAGTGMTDEDVARLVKDSEESITDAMARAQRGHDTRSDVTCPECGCEFQVDLNLEAVDRW